MATERTMRSPPQASDPVVSIDQAAVQNAAAEGASGISPAVAKKKGDGELSGEAKRELNRVASLLTNGSGPGQKEAGKAIRDRLLAESSPSFETT